MYDPNVYTILKDAADLWPDKPAVYDELGSLSFAQLLAETEALRLQLIEMGINQGMGVGIRVPNGRYFIISLFAVVGCGAAVMPISHQLKKEEIDDILDEAKLHAILDYKKNISSLENTAQIIPVNIGAFILTNTGICKEQIFAPHVSRPAFMRFTSGTTGKSKGVIISHKAVFERIEGANKGLELNSNDTVVWVLPMAYHFVVSIVLYIRFGAAIAIVKDFLAKNIIDITNLYNGTLLYASPVQIRLLANDTGNEQMPSLKKVISTSASISVEVCLAFKNRYMINVSQAYGIIEIGLPMMNLIKNAQNPDAVGYALPGYSIEIFDDNYNPLPDGTVGQLGISGPGMFDAYLLPPVLCKDVLKKGYFLTADYASKAPDGLVKIEGRSKSVINISGIKVFPEEIEAFLENIPGIKQARISSSPHPLLGQLIEGEIVLHEGKTIDTDEIINYCRKRLSSFKAPQRLKVVTTLPMTGSGKIQRH